MHSGRVAHDRPYELPMPQPLILFKHSQGFTLIAVIGVMAMLTITVAALAPNVMTVMDRKVTQTEKHHLKTIAEGSALYLRGNLAWPPTLAAHSPAYVPFESTQLLQNARGYPRYFHIHPDTAGFNNQTGLSSADLSDARLLLISDTSQDAAPVISNATQFETWWSSPETQDLHMYKAHVANLFHEVTLTGYGNGGSYQIHGATTNSGGTTVPTHSQYHLNGTVVALDEASSFATPEMQFTLTKNVSYVFVPCFPSGTRWRVPPPAPCPVLWVTTKGNANGTPGLSSWTDSQLVAFVDPDLTYENGPTGQTSGNFALTFDLENFTGSADIDAIHFVAEPVVVGTTNTVSLAQGDLLLSTTGTEFLLSTNFIFVRDEDVFVFRPDSVNDYSSGTFILLIHGSDLGLRDVEAVTVVEATTVVGDATLQPGTLLLADRDEDILQFVPTSVGSSTSGNLSLFLDGSDIRLSHDVSGIHLVQAPTNIGDVSLQSGQILATMERNDNSTGDNGIRTRDEDIFILDITDTGSSTAGTATLLFDGSDVSMKAGGEDIDGLTLNGRTTNSSADLTIINPDFETGDLSGWTKTGDLLGTGGVNQWGAVTSASAMSTPHGGSYFAGGRATGQIGSGAHITGLYQRIDVSAHTSQIDDGTATVNIAGFGHGETSRDRAYLRIAYYDAVSGGNQLGSDVDSNEATQSQTWTFLSITGNSVPVGTRSIELLLLGYKVTTGSYLDAGIDDVSATLSYP